MQRASFTAEAMALHRAFETEEPPSARLFTDELAERFLSWPLRVLLRAGRTGLATYDLVAGPGPRASAIARTRAIDDTIQERVAAGVSQVVLLGAGFDTRAHRLAALRGARVFELDEPHTQARKRSALTGARGPACVDYVACDFERDDPADGLERGGLSRTDPAVVVWEGVTNYLSEQAVRAVLGSLKRVLAPGSTLLFTYVDQRVLGPEGVAAFPEARRWLRAVNRAAEPWRFGLPPGGVSEFLRAQGFELTLDQTTKELGDAYFTPLGRREVGSRLYHVVRCERANA